MSLEHSPSRSDGSSAAQTITEFCTDNKISRSKLYEEWRAGAGPRYFLVGTHRRISREAAAEWRRQREAESVPAA